MLETGKEICRQIEKKGHQALIVGGAVRDIQMGKIPHDVDMATDMPIMELEKEFKSYNIGKSKGFGILTIEKEGHYFEIAQFRTDGQYKDGRRPEKIKLVASFEKDASRRDFTINAMGMTADGKILDYFNGTSDLKDGIIRTVGNPEKRFAEDKLRMVRLARFSARYDFKIDKQTRKIARKMADQIAILAMERLTDELVKAAELGGKKFANYVRILEDLKLLRHILPEIAALRYMPHTQEHHPESSNVLGHALKALECTDSVIPLELMAILLHDVGKLTSQGIGTHSGHHKYHGHDKTGAIIVNDIAKRMKFSNKDRETMVFCARNHMRFHKIPEMKASKIAKLVCDTNFPILAVVCEADNIGRYDHAGTMARALSVKIKVEETKSTDLVTGNMIMDLLSILPGKEVGRIKKVIAELVIDNGITDPEEIVALIFKIGKKKSWLKTLVKL